MILVPRFPKIIPGVNYLLNPLWGPKAFGISPSATRMGMRLVDQHFTPEWCIQALLNVYETPAGNLLEPARGIDRLLPSLQAHHKAKGQVHASDISDHLFYGNFIGPFYWWYSQNRKHFSCIITNPPFTLAQKFVERAFLMLDPQWGGDVVLLLRIGFLASKRRREFWKKYPLTALYILSRRPSFRLTSGETDMQEYAWFLWSTRDKQLLQRSGIQPYNWIGMDDAEAFTQA